MRQPILLLLAGIVAVLLPRTAWSDSITLTVAGDVDQPDTYVDDLQGPATVRDLLIRAGIEQESQGTACLFRGNPPQFVDSETIQATAVGRSQQLASGDVVIFHDVTKSSTDAENVVIATGGMPRVVQLLEPETSVAELLEQLETDFTAKTRIPLLRTENGVHVPMKVKPDEFLAHGDVVQLSIVKNVDPVTISRLFAAPSPEADRATVADGSSPGNNGAQTVPPAKTRFSHSAPNSMADGSAGERTLNAIVVSETADIRSQAFIDRFEIPRLDFPALPMTAGQPESAVSSTAQNTGPADSANASAHRDHAAPAEPLVTEQRTRPANSATSQTSRSRTLPPFVIPDVDTTQLTGTSAITLRDPAAASSTSASAIWNGIFVFGLIGAIVLIATGWLKTRAEQKSAAIRARELMNLTIADSIHGVEEAAPLPEQSAAATADAELERLIQNRIPVQLCQADLPLRVTLFGRPAGPKRLRVDAAHQKVAAPHFAGGSRKQSRRREQVQAAPVSPQATESGSLDRALNSLRGRQS